MRDAVCSSKERIFVGECSRRWGKSYLACVIAVEQCLQQPSSQVKYAAPTKDMARRIIAPHLRSIFADAPDELKPEFKAQEGVWLFKNGSQLCVAGCDKGGADSLRGTSMHFGVVDEAGFIDDLDYLIDSVLTPQMMTTNGRMLIISTPPMTLAHPSTRAAAHARDRKAHTIRTIYDAPHVSDSIRTEFCEMAGGAESTAWRREYLCEHVVDDTMAVLPEFTRVEKSIVRDDARPEFYVPFIVADFGYHDMSFAVFGYHDFRNAVDVIEDEYVAEKQRAGEIDEACTHIATNLWGEGRALKARRIADAQPMVLAEIPGWRGMVKTQTNGVFKSAAVNDLRTRLAGLQLRIHPRCHNLINHCRYAVWRVPGKDLAHMEGFGHFDGVDALTYFVRRVDRRNPYPLLAGGISQDTHFIPPELLEDVEKAKVLQLFGRKKRR